MKLNQKTALLTGASGGIGQALARDLSAKGARLILIGREQQRLEALRNTLPEKADIIVADLLSAADRITIAETVTRSKRPVDILINNAGVSDFRLFESCNDTEIEQMMQLNLIAPMQLTRSLLPALNQNASQIVNIGSTFGSIGYPGFTCYCASKYGLRGFSEALSRELADTNTIVQHIAPRATKTSINSSAVVSLNERLGNHMDTPQWVSAKIVQAIEKEKKSLNLGWPEKLFVTINATFSSIVERHIATQLPAIKSFAQEN